MAVENGVVCVIGADTDVMICVLTVFINFADNSLNDRYEENNIKVDGSYVTVCRCIVLHRSWRWNEVALDSAAGCLCGSCF